MKPPSKLARAAVLISSCTLLVAYVAYSHITPNSPPPDPLGLSATEASAPSNTIDLTIEPEVVEFDKFINYGTPVPPTLASRPQQELRIISSKVINQPIFNVRNGPFSWRKPSPKQKPKVRLNEFGVQLDGGLPR
ncbi:MAG TPA: hypothetical protein VGE39_00645 [Prosthecobacter sp.]